MVESLVMAYIFVPSDEQHIPVQFLDAALCVQLLPVLVDTWMNPVVVTAAIIAPLLEQHIPLLGPSAEWGDQVTPPLVVTKISMSTMAALIDASDDVHILPELDQPGRIWDVQFIPPSTETNVNVSLKIGARAIIVCPSAEQHIPVQFLLDSLCVQVMPASMDVYMKPPYTVAAIYCPSNEQHMLLQLRGPAMVLWIQLMPPSVDVYMYPPYTIAAMMTPLLEQHILLQLRAPALDLSIHSGGVDMICPTLPLIRLTPNPLYMIWMISPSDPDAGSVRSTVLVVLTQYPRLDTILVLDATVIHCRGNP